MNALGADSRYAQLHVVGYLATGRAAAFGGDEDNTVGTAGTVDSGCRGVFQNFDRGDVGRVDVVDGVIQRERAVRSVCLQA